MSDTQTALLDSLREMVANAGSGFEYRNAAENTYCPECATEADRWTDQLDHHPGCPWVARLDAARAALAKAEGR